MNDRMQSKNTVIIVHLIAGIYIYRRTLFKCVVKCLRFREKREIASLIFAFARGFTWFARGSLIYCVLLNAIVEKTLNSQLLDSRI